LKVTAPEKRAPLARETIGLVCSHFPVSDNDAGGRRRTVMGAPPCLECLAIFEPMNDRDRAAVSHSSSSRVHARKGFIRAFQTQPNALEQSRCFQDLDVVAAQPALPEQTRDVHIY